MLKDFNPMRLPPLLVAVSAVLADPSLSIPARGQTPEAVSSSKALPSTLNLPATAVNSQNQQPGQQSQPGLDPASSSGVAQLFPGEDQQAPTPQFPPPTQPPGPTQRAPEVPIPAPEDTDQEPVPQPPQPAQPAQPPQPPPEGEPAPTPETPPGEQPAPTLPGEQPAPTLPGEQPAPTFPAQPEPSAAPEPQVLVAEVVVSGAEGELQDEVYRAIQTQPGRTTTRSQLQEDINAVFATGFFSNVRAQPEDTPLGVRVTFFVEPNPVVRSIQLEGNQVLTQAEVDKIFSPQYGQILNFRSLQAGIKQLNQAYQARGYVLGQVVGAPKVDPSGTVILQVAEGVIEDVRVRFLNKEDQPIDGKTREFIVTREITLKPGVVFNRNEVQKDLQRVYGLGIFEDVQVALEPGQDPRKVDVVLNIKERNTGSFGAGAGLSSASGLFGSVTYQEQNLGGNNQKLGAEIQVSQRDILFDLSFTDPWIAGDPYRTSYTVNLFNRLTRPYVFDGGEVDVNLPPEPVDDDDDDIFDEDEAGNLIFEDEGDDPRVNRLGGGVTFSRPLAQGWTGSLGLQYQRVSIRDADLSIAPVACIDPDLDPDLTPQENCAIPSNQEQLSFSGTGQDDLTTLRFSLARDLRDDPLRPTRGSLLRLSTEQTVPIGLGSILGNKLVGSYSYYIPVRFTSFTEGPQTLAFNVQAGTAIGDLPPYEAFSLGGSNSVRGYGEGELGTGRSFAQFSAEYRFPVFSVVGGALFLDAASDLGTADTVLGQPAVLREKPGSGFGYGLGVRVQTPLGPIRVDYGFNNEGDSRLHFGIGERF